MTDEDELLDEPEQGAATLRLSTTKGRRSFRKVRRELNEEELSSPAAQRLILDELDRLEEENSVLQNVREDFHRVDKKASVLEEKLKKHNALDILSSAALIAGSLTLGYAPKVWNNADATGPLLLVVGVLLIAGGIWSKAARS